MNDDADFVAEALPVFISEATEQTDALEQLLLQLEEAPGDTELLGALFRCAHTVKGSAGIFGLDRVVAFTHHVETLLDRMRDGTLALTPAISTLLLQANDEMRALVAVAREPDSESEATLAARERVVERLQAASAVGDDGAPLLAMPIADAAPIHPSADASADGIAGAAGAAATQRWRLDVRFGAETFRNGMDPLAILNYLGGVGTVSQVACDRGAVPPLDALDPERCHLGFTFVLDTAEPRAAIEDAFSFVRDDCTVLLTADAPEAASPVRAAAATAVATAPAPRPEATALAAAPPPSEENRYIRVHADRLDAVINLLGELVIAGSGASLLARQSGQGALVEANQQITRLVEEIRSGTLKLRMVPIGETFARFRRVVRDTAAELGKEVNLEIVGGETELDKAVVERIADPLMHLVRNALDHGLEQPVERIAAGKPAQGRLTLSARHETGSVLIRIVDDGRGIQRDRVLQRAWDRGLVEPGVVPRDADLLNLIFEAGFSTAEAVTNLSGRGVGMDVVRRNIEALRGTVEIGSEAGAGSSIEIRLPLTLAIIDGFLIGVGGSKFIFPLDAVVEVIEHGAAAGPLDALGRGCVPLRGELLPVVALRTLYGLESVAPERTSVVVVRAGAQRYGVLVDLLLGQHQTVIKPLGRMFRSLRGMSGSSILGNGEVALIIDVPALGQLAAQHRLAPSRAAAPIPNPAPRVPQLWNEGKSP